MPPGPYQGGGGGGNHRPNYQGGGGNHRQGNQGGGGNKRQGNQGGGGNYRPGGQGTGGTVRPEIAYFPGRPPPADCKPIAAEGTQIPTPRVDNPQPTNQTNIDHGRQIIQERGSDKLLVHAEFPIRRTQGETRGDDITIVTNHLAFNMKPKAKIYHYRISGMSNSTGKATKRILIVRLLQQSTWLQSLNYQFATDYETSIFTWIKHLNPSDLAAVNTKSSYKKDAVPMSLEYQGEVDLDLLDQYAYANDNPYMVLNANGQPLAVELEQKKSVANALISTAIGPNLFVPKANKFFVPSGVKPISRSLCTVRGYFYSTRPGMGQQLLNINVCTSAFFRPVLVSDFLEDMYTFDATTRRKTLSGLRVKLEYTPKCEDKNWSQDDKDDMKLKKIHKVGDKSVTDQVFTYTDLSNVQHTNKVGKHFEDGYPQFKLHKTHLSAINCGSQDHPKWYPPEMLRIVPGQIYKKVIPIKFTTDMINTACHRPELTGALVEHEGIPRLGLNHQSQVMAFPSCPAIEIDPRLLEVKARILTPPTIVFGNREDPAGLKWDLRERLLYSTQSKSLQAKPENRLKVHVFVVQSGDCLDQTEAARIMKDLQHYATKYEITQFQQTTYTTISHAEFLAKARTEMKDAVETKKANFILLLMNQKDIPIYSLFKDLADRVCGVHALCIITNKRAWNGTLWGNLMLKVNLKKGEGNFSARGIDSIMKDTLVLGADVTHAGPGSLAGTPSVAAIVGSVNASATKFLGSMRLQQRSTACEDILKVQEMVVERLHDWYDVNKRLPKNVLYYRDGVSESQYSQVLTSEVQQIWNAIKVVAIRINKATGTKYLPPDFRITAVIVGKRHHVRFFPMQSELDNGNCYPGTLVDSVVTSPYFRDFYLQSHNSIKGTARPAHYFMIVNQMGITDSELQEFTFRLSHTYVRATMAVSYAPPAYYADRLCERGRCYLRDFFVPTQGSETAKKHQTEKDRIEGEINGNVGHRPNTDDMEKSDARKAKDAYNLKLNAAKVKINELVSEMAYDLAAKHLYGKDQKGDVLPDRNPWRDEIAKTMFWM